MRGSLHVILIILLPLDNNGIIDREKTSSFTDDAQQNSIIPTHHTI